MKVNNIFYSCQGEGINTGLPMNFIRLAGCNLQSYPCHYCDTPQALGPNRGKEMSIPDILVACNYARKGAKCPWYCITGGEPLMQEEDLRILVNTLRSSIEHGSLRLIEVETNGTMNPPAWYQLVDCWVVDCKCPSSGVSSEYFVGEWKTKLRDCDQLKFVVSNKEDLDYVLKITQGGFWGWESQSMGYWNCTVVVSPRYPYTTPFLNEVVEFCLRHNFRLSVQSHKLIGVK